MPYIDVSIFLRKIIFTFQLSLRSTTSWATLGEAMFVGETDFLLVQNNYLSLSLFPGGE